MLKLFAIVAAVFIISLQIYDYVWLGHLAKIPEHVWDLIKASFFCWLGWHILQKIST